MELRDYVGILRKRWMTVVVVTLVGLAAAAAATLRMDPQYTATSRLFFAVQSGETVGDLWQGSSFAEEQMSSYAAVAQWPLVLEPVIEQLELDATPRELAQAVSTTVTPNTVILNITAVAEDPETAAAIANAVGVELASVVGTLTPQRSDGSETVRATIGEVALPPESPSSPKMWLNLALGLVLGAMAGVVLAVVRNGLDTKVRTEADVADVSSSAVIGAIAFDATAPRHPVVMTADPHSLRAEAVRRLRTNLQYVNLSANAPSIVITSSVPGEGKTTTAVNLAVALAEAGQRVILVDADLRRPSVAKTLGLEGGAGLTSVLIGHASLEDVVQQWNRTSLDVLASGAIPPNPSELLGSRSMGVLLDTLSARYDVVLIDAPPLLPVTDPAVLAKIAGGTVVVVGADIIHKPQLREALGTLQAVDAPVLGLVLNKISARDRSTYAYRYRYTSEAPTPPARTRAEEPVRLESAPEASPASQPELAPKWVSVRKS